MFDNSTLAVINCGAALNIMEITSSYTLKKIDQYPLPFKENDLLSISMSNNQNLIVVGGQKNMIVSIIIYYKLFVISNNCIAILFNIFIR